MSDAKDIAGRLSEAEIPPCKSCDHSFYKRNNIKPEPAVWVCNAHKDARDGAVFAWPLCVMHVDMAMVAWGQVYEVGSEKGAELLKIGFRNHILAGKD